MKKIRIDSKNQANVIGNKIRKKEKLGNRNELIKKMKGLTRR